MKHKLIAVLLMSSTLLFSNSITGAWTIDKAKAEKLFKTHAGKETEQFIIAFMVKAMANIEFRKDGSCQITTKNRAKCWKKLSDKSYILYEEDGSSKGVKVEVTDENSLKLMINEPKLQFSFNRNNK